MRSVDEVRDVLALVERGLNDSEISRRTKIPRCTVRDWRQGKIPRRDANGERPIPLDCCRTYGQPEHSFNELPAKEYAYLLGLYLGDGRISAHRRGVFRLRIVLDSQYPKIIDECAAAMAAVMPSSKVGVLHHLHQNSVEVGSYSKAWPCLFPQHGPGKKHLRQIELSDWQRAIVTTETTRLLRGLIHSDGCHSVNTIRHPKKTYAGSSVMRAISSGSNGV
jgi:hypothetical protein